MSVKTNSDLKIEEKILHLKNAITELELQLDPEKTDSIDEFEKLKNNFSKFINEIKDIAHDSISGEKAEQLKTLIEELQVQLALGKAETKHLFEEQKEGLFKVINNIESFLSEHFKTAKTQLEKPLDKFNDITEKLQSMINISKLHFALGKAEFKYDFLKNKTQLSQKIAEIKSEIDVDVEKAEQKLNNLKDEVKDVVHGFLKALKK